MNSQAGKCVFFDRDGIVNRSPGPGWVERWEDLHILPEFLVAARTVLASGYAVVIITNQRGVALGLFTMEALEEMHARLVKTLNGEGVPILGIYTCPHERDTCTCRKPLPGLLEQAAREHPIDLSASWMIGDKESDVAAGRSAGCRTILVNPTAETTRADHHVVDLAELNTRLIEWL